MLQIQRAFLLLLAGWVLSANVYAAEEPAVPKGNYTLDKAHGSLIFRVNHLGFSNYTARFTRFDASMTFDPANPGSGTLHAVVDATSLQTDFPTPEVIDFNQELQSAQWLNTAAFPEMRFDSKTIVMSSEHAGVVTGDFTLRGITRPVSLAVIFNGGYAGHPMDPHARVGFSATGTLKRSDFGIDYGIPAPGTTMGVSDEVQVIIEAEFSGPALNPAGP
jgi:polyisoprenoid-binding protein YceI